MELLDYILHIDLYLQDFLIHYAQWFYLLLFIIIFCETGLVVLPFLPGDSLLFASGMLAAAFPNQLNIYFVLLVLWSAAIVGDTLNYTIGQRFGLGLLDKQVRGRRIISEQTLHKTQNFFTTYGAKTIVIARFVPIVRTLAPFVAGFSRMHYPTFLKYNLVGGTLWVGLLTLTGFFLGTRPIVQQNFEIIVLLIIAFSLLPVLIEAIRAKMKK